MDQKHISDDYDEREEFDWDDYEDGTTVLINEARKINEVIPQKSLEEVYSYLEANMDRKDRFQLVLDEFLLQNEDITQHNDRPEETAILERHTTLKVNKSAIQSDIKINVEVTNPWRISRLDSYNTLPASSSSSSAYSAKKNDAIIRKPQAEALVHETISFTRIQEKRQQEQPSLSAFLQMLPNVDPTYLQGIFDQCHGNPETLTVFVNNVLQGNISCPSLKEYYHRKILDNICSNFIKKFDINAFLELFPDPETYFFNSRGNISETYRHHTLEYLKIRFRQLYLTTIYSALNKNRHLLCPTVKFLDESKNLQQMEKIRPDVEFEIPADAPEEFVYDLACVVNSDEVEAYIKRKRQIWRKAFEQAKKNNQLVTCKCCFHDELIVDDTSTCTKGHLFCIACVIQSGKEQLKYNKIKIECLEPGCRAEFQFHLLKRVLGPKLYLKMVRQRQLEEIWNVDLADILECPFCDFPSLLQKNLEIFTCENPDCLKLSCRLCKESHHLGQTCSENKEIKMRTYIEDMMTEAFIRTCPQCKTRIIKEQGCHHIQCPCGLNFCYWCRNEMDSCKCAYVDPAILRDINDVKLNGQKAKMKMMEENPEVQLEHDPTTYGETKAKKRKKEARTTTGTFINSFISYFANWFDDP